MAISYKDAGVDVTAGYKAVELMKKHVKSTYNQDVLGDIGSFGGFLSLSGMVAMAEPVLVAGTDGVGTKLKYAFLADKHDTVGIDCVAMCVNDIVCQGAAPLLFLDYIALPKLIPEKVEQIVKGMSEGCRQAGCALLGGETAEMPGFYAAGEYDVAGFCVGMVNKPDIINGSDIKSGDVLIGLQSSGLHSNGFSLVRKIFGEELDKVNVHSSELDARIIDTLLTPTKIYVKTILQLIKAVKVKGIAHITGGGFIENIPRILPEGIGAAIDTDSYEMPAIFNMVKTLSGLGKQELYNTFNMGIGMVIAVDKADADKTVRLLNGYGEKAFVIGEAVKGGGVRL